MLVAILAISGVLALVSAVLFQAPELMGRDKVLTDFDAFYVAGMMANGGQATEAYQATKMIEAQHAFSGTTSFMPWTYLPPYLLLVSGLASLPIGVAFLLFATTTFAFYVLVLRRIAGAYLPGVLIATLPTILLIARTGQNGFLTAGLIGCFLLTFTERRAVAGVPLGLMIIKPHLAAGIALLALLDRRWMAMIVAAAIVIGTMLSATLAFGIDIWPAFFGGVREAGQFLAAGFYPLFRMSSIYAFVMSFGGSSSLAFALQAFGALIALGSVVYAWRSKWEPRLLAGTVCVSSLLVSPYNYDYDLTILGVAFAFVLPHVVAEARRWELVGLLILSWAVTGYGLATNTFHEQVRETDIITSLQSAVRAVSLTGPLLILLVAASFAVLRRSKPRGVATLEAKPAT